MTRQGDESWQRIHGFCNYCLNNMFKAYRLRLYHDGEQKVLIETHTASCRCVWNHFPDLRNNEYARMGKGMSYKDESVLLPALKEEKEWLNGINSQSLQQELLCLDSAFHGFFKKISKYPIFKKNKTGGSFAVPQHFALNDNHLTIPKFKTPLRLFMHRNIEGEMKPHHIKSIIGEILWIYSRRK